MQITFTKPVEDFLKARFETDDIEPIVQKYVNDWATHLIDVAFSRAPSAANRIQAATADVISRKEEADIRKAERDALK